MDWNWNNILGESSLYLVEKPYASMKIFVAMPTGKTLSLDVEPHHSVKNLKEKIQDKQGIPCGKQRLGFCGQDLKDHFTLEDYHILNDSTLHLVLRESVSMQIFVKTPTGDTIMLEAEPYDSVKNVKIKIQEKKEYLPEKQRLSFGGKLLSDDDCTLSEYSIEKDSTLLLALRPVMV